MPGDGGEPNPKPVDAAFIIGFSISVKPAGIPQTEAGIALCGISITSLSRMV